MITSEYMSEEEAEKYQGKMHFMVHSPDFISTDKCFLPFYMPIVIVHHTVLNQLISKLDRRLQKSSAASIRAKCISWCTPLTSYQLISVSYPSICLLLLSITQFLTS